jgi:hypothetical protein
MLQQLSLQLYVSCLGREEESQLMGGQGRTQLLTLKAGLTPHGARASDELACAAI